MKNVNEAIENAKRKSIKKGIPIKYKGQIIKLDPTKVAIASFGLTASLVIAGIATSKLIDKVETKLEENEIVKEYNDEMNDTWKEEVHRVDNNRSYAIDYSDIAIEILKDEDTREQKLYSYICSRYKETEITDLLQILAFTEGKSYKNLNEYVIERGFNSVDEWKNYCKDQILKSSNNGRTM